MAHSELPTRSTHVYASQFNVKNYCKMVFKRCHFLLNFVSVGFLIERSILRFNYQLSVLTSSSDFSRLKNLKSGNKIEN